MVHPVFGNAYRVVEQLAVGGMAEVYLAFDLRVDPPQPVAIKRIRSQDVDDPSFRWYFEAETRLGLHLEHPNVVRTLDHGEEQGGPYLVLEHVNGFDLRWILARLRKSSRRLPLPFAAYIAHCLLAGLDHAHHARDDNGRPLQIVLCDVSPANVIVACNGEVKLIDFGIASSAISRVEQIGVLKGKKRYIAPEQLRGLPLDGRADVFSVGICLYEMLTGTFLLSSKNAFEIEESIRTGNFPSLSSEAPHIPPAFEEVWRRAVAVDRDARFGSAASFAEALEPYLKLGSGKVMDAEELAKALRVLFPREVRMLETGLETALASITREEREQLRRPATDSVPDFVTQGGMEHSSQAGAHPPSRSSRAKELLERARRGDDTLPQAEPPTATAALASEQLRSASLAARARELEQAGDHRALLTVVLEQIELEKRPNILAHLRARAGALVEATGGDEQVAMMHYQDAIRFSPGFEPPFASLIDLAMRRGDRGMIRWALEQRLRGETGAAERASVLTRLAAHALENGETELAIAELRRAVEEHPRGLPARLALLELLLDGGHLDEAATVSAPRKSAPPPAPSELSHLALLDARLAEAQGRYGDAIDCIAVGLGLSPDPTPLLDWAFDVVRLRRIARETPAALARLAAAWEAADARSWAAQARLVEALLLWHAGRADDAHAALARARSLAPDLPDVHLTRASFSYELRQFPEALAALSDASDSAPLRAPEIAVRRARIAADHLRDDTLALQLLRDVEADLDDRGKALLSALERTLQSRLPAPL